MQMQIKNENLRGASLCFTVLHQFSSVQSLSRVQLFATPWIAARQASPSITNSRGSLRLTSIESVLHRLKQNVEFLGCVAEIKMNLYLNIIDRMGHSALQIIAVDLKQNF